MRPEYLDLIAESVRQGAVEVALPPSMYSRIREVTAGLYIEDDVLPMHGADPRREFIDPAEVVYLGWAVSDNAVFSGRLQGYKNCVGVVLMSDHDVGLTHYDFRQKRRPGPPSKYLPGILGDMEAEPRELVGTTISGSPHHARIARDYLRSQGVRMVPGYTDAWQDGMHVLWPHQQTYRGEKAVLASLESRQVTVVSAAERVPPRTIRL